MRRRIAVAARKSRNPQRHSTKPSVCLLTNFRPINDWYIRINGNEHGVPHVHVVFRDGSKVSVSIEGREVLAGGVKPAHRLNEVRQNIAEHTATYLAEYRRLNP